MTQAPVTAPTSDLSENGDCFPKAVKRAAKLLRLPADILARTLGVSRNTAHHILAGNYPKLGVKATARATQLIAVWRAAHALVGGDDNKLQAWLKTTNSELGGIPQEVIQSEDGLEQVWVYFYGSDGR